MVNYILKTLIIFLFLINSSNCFSKNFININTYTEISNNLISEIYFDILFSKIKKVKINRQLKIKIIDSIIYYSLKYNINPVLIFNIIKTESNFNPHAVSNKNAKGLMQLRDIAIKDLNVKLKNKSDIFSINTNIELGIKYFKKMLNLADGNISLALTYYNKGIGNIKNSLKKGIKISQLINNKYVKKIYIK